MLQRSAVQAAARGARRWWAARPAERAARPASQAAAGPASFGTPGDLRRAEGLSLPVGALAGVFGSVAGSGGAAVVTPLVSKSSPSIPQR